MIADALPNKKSLAPLLTVVMTPSTLPEFFCLPTKRVANIEKIAPTVDNTPSG